MAKDEGSEQVEVEKVYIGENGKPMARITWGWEEKVGIPDTYSSIGIPYAGATVYCEHDHAVIAQELEELALTIGKVVAKMRTMSVESFQRQVPRQAA
jgi:hypothetical protein